MLSYNSSSRFQKDSKLYAASASQSGAHAGRVLRITKLGGTQRASIRRHFVTIAEAAEPPLPPWDTRNGMQAYLNKEDLQSIEPDQAYAAIQEGVCMLDVRSPDDFKDVHAAGAVGVPLYVGITGFSPFKLMKRAVYAVNGMTGTEPNQNFLQDVEKAFPDKEATILVMCDSGGTYRATDQFQSVEGRRSRSLIACYRLMAQAGYKNVLHVEGGLRTWCLDELPIEGEDTDAWIKKVASMP